MTHASESALLQHWAAVLTLFSKPAKYETSGNPYVIQSWAARLAGRLIRRALARGAVDRVVGGAAGAAIYRILVGDT